MSVRSTSGILAQRYACLLVVNVVVDVSKVPHCKVGSQLERS